MAVGPGVAVCDGRYLLERMVGTGGMASVWLGHDQRLDRAVAVKVLSDTLAADPAFVQRFRREAQTAARLSHPNLVKVYDYEPSGRPALIMEYVEGGTLDETANRTETAVEVEALAAQLLGALEHIHAAGIVHRDVKPGNVLIGDDGRALLTDFGIAQHQDATRITQTGQVIGTLAYMAPEVLEGERATPQSDLYSCGVVLRDHLRPDGPPGLSQLVERLTERDPGLRPASAKRALSYLAGATPSAVGASDRAAITTQPMASPEPTPRDPAEQDTSERSATSPPSPRSAPRHPTSSGPAPVPAQREYAVRGSHVLAAVALLAAVIAVIAIAMGGDGDGSASPDRASGGGSAAEAETAPEAAAPGSEATTTEPIPAPEPSADPAKGTELNDQAFGELQSGDVDKALKTYEKALSEFPEETRTPEAFDQNSSYAYALYGYGDALVQVGRPEEAIPVLEQRLAFDDQQETVQAKLDEAEAAAGQ